MYNVNTSDEICEIILDLIPSGRDNAVNVSYIASTAGCSDREVKYAIQKLRMQGNAICSSTYYGYWMAESAEDLADTLAQMRSRIKTLAETVDALVNSMP